MLLVAVKIAYFNITKIEYLLIVIGHKVPTNFWSIQIFAQLFPVVDRCSFLDNVKNTGLASNLIGLFELEPRSFPFSETLQKCPPTSQS